MNTTLFFYLVHPLVALFASVGYAIVCNAPRKEIPYCGLTAFLCWLVYQLVLRHDGSSFLATLLATFAATGFARFLSYHRMLPTIVYHIPAPPSGTRCGGSIAAITSARKARAGNNRKYSDSAKAGRCHRLGSVIILVLPQAWILFLPQIKEKKQLSRILSNERRNALWITIQSLSISLWMQAKSC